MAAAHFKFKSSSIFLHGLLKDKVYNTGVLDVMRLNRKIKSALGSDDAHSLQNARSRIKTQMTIVISENEGHSEPFLVCTGKHLKRYSTKKTF